MGATHVHAAKRRMQELADEAKQVVESKSLDFGRKKASLDKIEAELTQCKNEIDGHNKAQWIMGGGGSLHGPSGLGYSGFDTGHGSAGSRVPRLQLSESEMKGLFDAARTKSRFRVETKAPMSAGTLLPAQLLPGIVGLAHEPVRILDYIPASPMAGPSIEFISHTATTGAAAAVTAGTAKPEIGFTTIQTILPAVKIAGWCSVQDETLGDFGAFAQYLSMELQRALVDAENAQVLNGNGTAPNMLGISTTSGLLTRAVGTPTSPATALDVVEMAISDLRTGATFTTPDLLVLNPADWSKLRRVKDLQGRFLLNSDPTQGESDSIWGIKVLPTTSMTAGTGLLGNFAIGAQAFLRQGPTIEASNSDGSDFVANITKYRIEERVAVGVARPSAFVKITGI